MEYAPALSRAWMELEGLTDKKTHSVKFLADEYDVNVENKQVLSVSCNTPATPHIAILLLHYLAQNIKGLPALRENWISFKQLESGAQPYYPVFKKRVIDVIARKHGEKPEGLLEITSSFKSKRTQMADFSVVIEVCDGVPLVIELWKGDEEFGPEANVLFDETIKDIFCTEDIIVLCELVAHSI